MGSNLFGDELPKTALEQQMEVNFPLFYKDNVGGFYMYYNEKGDCATIHLKKCGNTQFYGNMFPENEPVEERVIWMKVASRRPNVTIITPEEFEEANQRYNDELTQFFNGGVFFSESPSETRPLPKLRENHGRG